MDGETPKTAADLSREELYALVWELPLRRIGPELGLDGPRLAKLCDKRQIPYPPSGYRQKKAVGRALPAPTLPPADDPVAAPKPPPPFRSTERLIPTSRAKLPTRVEEVAVPPEEPVVIEATAPIDDGLDALDSLHPKIRVWIAEHKREQKERAQENRRRRNDVGSWSKSLLDDLTARDLYRIRASSTLCHGMEKAGAKVKEADIHGKLTFTDQGRDMSRPIKRPEGEAAKWTAYPHHHNSGLTSSGWLRAQITNWLPGEQPKWIEAPKKSFSALIPTIVETVIASVPRLLEWERQREEDRRRY